jgi:hypothetical protein
MVMIRANKMTEAGVMPSPELLEAMGKFNEEMVKAGVMESGEGLQPSSKGALVKFSGGKHTVIDGPFTEAKELIAGFWILKVKSKEEAIAWASRVPGGHGEVDHFGGEFALEVRQIFGPEDFGAELTPELREQEERLRKQTNSKSWS